MWKAESSTAFDAEEEFRFLAPLMDIRHVKRFVVCVRWSMQWIPYDARGWWEKPFELVEVIGGKRSNNGVQFYALPG